MLRLSAIFLCSSLIFKLTAGPEESILAGRAVATYWQPNTVEGKVVEDVLIELNDTPKKRRKVILVRFSIPESQYKKWREDLPLIHQFRISRAPKGDSILLESLGVSELNTDTQEFRQGSFPFWLLLKGNENTKLPYGKMVKAYTSLDWPLGPEH